MTRTGPIFISSEIFKDSGYASGHPLAIPRVSLATELCQTIGWLDETSYRESGPASVDYLARFHDRAYLDALLAAETAEPDDDTKRRFNIGVNGNPIFPFMFRRPATACEGGRMAAEILGAGGGPVFSPAGGQHHAMPGHASGFCFLNEPALSIGTLKDQVFGRIFYVDFDAHHGDGVEAAFADDDTVFTLSIHEAGRWPMDRDGGEGGPGTLDCERARASLNLPVPKGLNDTEFAYLIDTVVMPMIDSFRPDAVYLQCGTDALADDPQSKLALSNNALWQGVAAVRDAAPKLMVTGGGGYNPYAVARAWAGVWAVLGGFDVPERLPGAAEDLLRSVAWNHRLGREPKEEWLTCLADEPNEGAVREDLRGLSDAALTMAR